MWDPKHLEPSFFCLITDIFQHVPISSMAIIPSVVLHGSEKNDLGEGNHLAKDEPDVNHLDVGGGGQALHLADEDGGHHQHRCQVHTQVGVADTAFFKK